MRILLVEDCDDFCELLRVRLAKKFPAHFVLARTGQEAADLLQDSDFDLVVSDYHMEPGNGQWLYEFMQQMYPQTPLIVFTSAPDEVQFNEDTILKAVVEKPDFKSLFHQIEQVILGT